MLTENQIIDIGTYYIHPIYAIAASKIGEDESVDAFTNGHCFYYANELIKFLQGEYRNVDVDTLTTKQKKDRWNKIGKVVCFDSSHYFVEYNGNYFDGKGEIVQDKWNIYLGEHIGNYNSIGYGEKSKKSKLYYQGTNEKLDALAGYTMDKYRSAVWNIFHLVTGDFEDELITELEKTKDNDKAFRDILSKYAAIAIKKIKEENNLDELEDGTIKVGQVRSIILKVNNKTPKEAYEIKKQTEKQIEEEMNNPYVPQIMRWHTVRHPDKYITDDEPDMVKSVKKYVLQKSKKREDN